MKNILIYVLCYNDKTEKQANDEFSQYEWAKVYRIKEQNHLFEGVMFRNELMDMYDEWKDKDFVGTIAYSIFSKVSRDHFFSLLEKADQALHDVVFFNTKHDPHCLEESFHGKVGVILQDSIEKVFGKYDEKSIVLGIPRLKFLRKLRPLSRINDTVRRYAIFAFCNYFIVTTKYMLAYLDFFKNKWLPTIERSPYIWSDSKYNGKLSHEELIELTGKTYFPCHTFVNERVLSVFFLENNTKILY